MTTPTGIDKIAFHIPAQYLNLAELARRDGTDPDKYHTGIGQTRFAVAAHDEDVVTLAASAAALILDDADKAAIDTVLLATESGIDQAKAAAIYVHQLLGLKPNCRAVELKQACYSATAGLQLACAHVARYPEKKVLLIASDIARYDLQTPGEATQGAAAVAMLISAQPRIAVLEGDSGCHTADVMDFWRPNHRSTPLVDGKLSTRTYIEAASAACADYLARGGLPFAAFAQYCYHLPFNKMASKTHQRLCQQHGIAFDPAKLEPGLAYSRDIGNSYTASLYLSLCSALDARDDLGGKAIAMMSYGSGCVAEYFALRIQPGYRNHLHSASHRAQLDNRRALTLAEYQHLWQRPDSSGHPDITFPADDNAPRYRLLAIEKHERRYGYA
ncbi:MAG: hydroxymethylglutaryl-CoA synthase [Cardiobacteriaceae bacterium]|nr:hydroxymethylglutaryl-CoA synthase [Cardiobacteriaceae bacterium]